MDEQSASWAGHIITIIFTAAGGLFGYGRLTSKVEDNEAEITEIKERLNDRRGGVVTNESLDRRQIACKELVFSELSHVKETCERTESKVDEIAKELKAMRLL